MKPTYLTLLISILLLWAGPAQARELSALFLGNSYTHFPGSPENPGLPKLVQQIAESIEPGLHLKYKFNTPGGWSIEKHFNDPRSTELMREHYDAVILQGHSLDSLELTPWFEQAGTPSVKSFSVFLPKVLDLIFKNNSNVALYVTWGRNAKNELLQEEHPGLRFPAESSRAGQKWCGNDKFEYQKMLDQSYAEHSRGYPAKLAKVGNAWLSLQTHDVVSEDELYLSGDWSHPSELGSYVAALVLVRESLHLDIGKNRFIPKTVDRKKALAVTEFLAAP